VGVGGRGGEGAAGMLSCVSRTCREGGDREFRWLHVGFFVAARSSQAPKLFFPPYIMSLWFPLSADPPDEERLAARRQRGALRLLPPTQSLLSFTFTLARML
jgi:hypothetical protein